MVFINALDYEKFLNTICDPNWLRFVETAKMLLADNTKFIIKQGHPTSIFEKYLFGRRFEIYNFRNICCKISCLPACPRIFQHKKKGMISHFKRLITLKWTPRIFGISFLAETFEKASFDPYNFRITRL